MDEAFLIDRAAAAVDGVAVEVELHDVLGHDAARRLGHRHQKAIRSCRVTRADMTETVDHALLVEDAVGGDEIVDQRLQVGLLRQGLLRQGLLRRDRRDGRPEEQCDGQHRCRIHNNSLHAAFPIF